MLPSLSRWAERRPESGWYASRFLIKPKSWVILASVPRVARVGKFAIAVRDIAGKVKTADILHALEAVGSVLD
jgi:hypothetical protein